MTDLKELLRARAEQVGPIDSETMRQRVAFRLAGGEMKIASPARRRRGLALAAAAAAVVLIGLGGMTLLTRGTEPFAETSDPPATTVPTPTTVTTSSKPIALDSMPAALVMTWERVAASSELEGGWMNAITAGGPGLVAVGGSDGFRADAAVWVSSDGSTWERITSDAFSGPVDALGNDQDQVMLDVVAGRDGIVAVGMDSGLKTTDSGEAAVLGDAAVWFSADGYDWIRVSTDTLVSGGAASMHGVAVGGPGFVAVGSSAPEDAEFRLPAVWVSPDGLEWTAARHIESPTGAGVAMVDVVVWDGYLYAVGGIDIDFFNGSASSGSTPIVWRSVDGDEWEIVFDAGQGWMDSVTATDLGLMAVGGSGDPLDRFAPTRATAWSSPDGLTWSRVNIGDTVNPDYSNWPASIAAGDGITLAVGHAAGTRNGNYYPMNAPYKAYPEVWGTTDGSTWYLVADLGTVSRVTTMTNSPRTVMGEVLVFGDHVIAVGSDGVFTNQRAEGLHNNCKFVYDGWCRTDAAVWIGSLDR